MKFGFFAIGTTCRLRPWLLMISCVLLPGLASAQSADRWRLEITGAASSTYDFTTVTCNQAAPAGTETVNPSLVVWDDPANAGRVCVHDTGTGSGPLFALPIGAYSATLRAGNAAGYSVPSSPAPFSRLAPPSAAPANVRLVRGGS